MRKLEEIDRTKKIPFIFHFLLILQLIFLSLSFFINLSKKMNKKNRIKPTISTSIFLSLNLIFLKDKKIEMGHGHPKCFSGALQSWKSGSAGPLVP